FKSTKKANARFCGSEDSSPAVITASMLPVLDPVSNKLPAARKVPEHKWFNPGEMEELPNKVIPERMTNEFRAMLKRETELEVPASWRTKICPCETFDGSTRIPNPSSDEGRENPPT